MIPTYSVDAHLAALFEGSALAHNFVPVGVRDHKVIALCLDAAALQETATLFGINMVPEVVDSETFTYYSNALSGLLKSRDRLTVPTKESLARVPWDDVRELIVLPLYEHDGALYCLYHRCDDASIHTLSGRFKASVAVIKATPEAITQALRGVQPPNASTAPTLAFEQIFMDALRRAAAMQADDIVFDHRGSKGGEVIVHADLLPHVIRTLSEDDLRGVIRAALSAASIPSSDLSNPHTGRIELRLANRTEHCRLIYLPTHNALGTVSIRFTSREERFPALESLNLPRSTHDRLMNLALGEPGLIVASGAPGSGKTTLVYALQSARARAQGSRSARSFEGPVEGRRLWLAQTSIGELGGGLELKDLTPYLLGVPTDSVFVGQILTPEDAESVVRLSYSNIPTFTTLHASSSPHACWRLFNVGVNPADLSQIVRAILHQRRIRRLCECKVPAPESAARDVWREHISALDATYFAPQRIDAVFFEPRAQGCLRCRQTGYFGTVVAYELLEATSGVRDAIERKASTSDLMQADPGYAPVWVDIARLLLAGEIGVSDAIFAATPTGLWRADS